MSLTASRKKSSSPLPTLDRSAWTCPQQLGTLQEQVKRSGLVGPVDAGKGDAPEKGAGVYSPARSRLPSLFWVREERCQAGIEEQV